MIKFILFSTAILVSSFCNAQTWDEWFRQKKTQIKYLEEQILALHVYGNSLQKGYDIVQGGLSAIHDVKKGDFNLHKDYFNSLKAVNTAIANSDKIYAVINLQLQILQLNGDINKIVNSVYIRNNENSYVRKVMQEILGRCSLDISDLTNFTTDGILAMKDDERLKRIDALYSDMKDKYSFTCYLKEQIQLLSFSRTKESNTIQSLQSLYNIK